MLRAREITKAELSRAYVQPGQNAYDVAIVDHTTEEANMRAKRNKAMKKWKVSNEEDLYDHRRLYLDRQQKHIVLDSENQVLEFENIDKSIRDIRQEQGETKAKVFKQEVSEYNRKMKLHEKRFDFNNLQYTYLETRREMTQHSIISIDESMKKIQLDWKSREELEKELRELKEEAETKNEKIAKKDLKINEQKKTIDAMKKELCELMKDEMEKEFGSKDEENRNKKRKSNV